MQIGAIIGSGPSGAAAAAAGTPDRKRDQYMRIEISCGSSDRRDFEIRQSEHQHPGPNPIISQRYMFFFSRRGNEIGQKKTWS